MAYNTPESVADYLSRFQMQVTERTKGTFSPMHVKYSLALKMGSSSFETTFQSNPNVHGEPTVTQVFGALASDAMPFPPSSTDRTSSRMSSALT